MSDELVFDAAVAEIPVRLGDEKCTLRELTGEQRDTYLDEMAKKRKTNRNGEVVGVLTNRGLIAAMLTKSLVHENGEAFTVEEVDALPSSTSKALWDKSRELSGLTSDEEDEAGKG